MTEQFTLKNAQRLPGSKVLLSPLALLILAACGGGGGGSVATAPTTFTRSGSVVKGPLKDALAFLDYDGDGEYDVGEPSVRTNADGSYSLTGAVGNSDATLVAITDSSTIDTSSGTVLADVVLSAPATAKVVSMASTMMVESGMDEAEVQEALGISGDVDLLTFNPFDVSDSATAEEKQLARDVEVTSQKVSAVITSMAAAAKSAGLSGSDAFATSLQAVTTLVQDTATARADALAADPDADVSAIKVDLGNADQLSEIADAVATSVTTKQTEARAAIEALELDPLDPDSYTSDAAIAAGITQVTATAFDDMKTTVVSAVKNVNDVIETVTADNFKASESVYSVTQVLVEQVTTAVTNEKAAPGTGATSVTYSKTSALTEAIKNKAPTDIDLVVGGVELDNEGSGFEDVKVNEGTPIDVAIATIKVTDLKPDGDEQVEETEFTYTISGDDSEDADENALFSVVDGVLYFTSVPDYELKTSYDITITAKDSGGKSYAEKYTIEIGDLNDGVLASSFQLLTSGSQDAVFDDYVKGVTTEKSEALIDISTASGVADFGTLDVDVNNISAGLGDVDGFLDPTLTLEFAKVPEVDGGTVGKTVKIKVVDGSDAARNSATERSFTLSFEVTMTEVDDVLTLVSGTDITVTYLGVGDAEADATETTIEVPENNTLALNAETKTLDVKLLSLINKLPPGLVPDSVLGDGGQFHVSVTGLPVISEAGSEISKLTGVLNLVDRDHTPYIEQPADVSVADGDETTTILIPAIDAEEDDIIYSIVGAGDAVDGVVTVSGTYGNLSVTQASERGAYSYVLGVTSAQAENLANLADGVSAVEEFEVAAGDGTTSSQRTLTINVEGVNDAPEDIRVIDSDGGTISEPSITENVSGGVVGAISATDPDGDILYFTVDETDPDYSSKFEIKAVDGVRVLKFKDGEFANYETKKSYQVKVDVTDRDTGGLEASEVFTIDVLDVNEAPSLLKPVTATVVENSFEDPDAEGTLVGTDPEKADKEYIIIGDTAEKVGDIYQISGQYGQLRLDSNTGAYAYNLLEGGAVDALTTGDTVTTENFVLVVSDGELLSQQRTLSIKIQGFNDAPRNVAIDGETTAVISENVAGAEVGAVSSDDPEGDTVTYSLSEMGDYDKFEITEDGALSLVDAVSADYETQSSYSITVEADDGNSVTTQELTITVADVQNETNQFYLSSDSAGDALFVDYINGEERSETSITLTNTDQTLNFGTVYVDANNASLATSGSEEFRSPELSFTLDQLPIITGSETRTITVTVTEGDDGTRTIGEERKAVITFEVLLEGDGSTTTITAAAGGTATIDYFGTSSESSATISIENSGSNDISFVAGVNGLPSSLNLKILELLDKVSLLNPSAILGEGANLHVKVEGMPLATPDEDQQTVVAVEGVVIVKDLIAPESTISRIAYDSTAGEIVVQGTNFDQLDIAIGADAKSFLDWSKLTWDLDGGGSEGPIGFALADISSAIVSNAETITITLTSDKKSSLADEVGYDAGFDSDTMTVVEGFIRDKALNTTKENTDGAESVAVVNLDELVRISTDTSSDATVTDYLNSVADETKTTSVDVSVAGGVLSLGSVELDLNNIQNATEDDGGYKSPDLTLTIDDAALITGVNNVTVTLSIFDGSDGVYSSDSERKIDVTFTLSMEGDGDTSSLTAGTGDDAAVVTYYPRGDADGISIDVPNLGSNTLTISEGSNGLPSTITVRTLSLVEKLNEINASDVLGSGGDFYLSVTGLPIADEYGPITEVVGQVTIKDLVPPKSTVVSAVYDDDAGTITLTGTKFDEIGLEPGDSVKAYLDFEKIVWDIDGSGSSPKTFEADDFVAETTVYTDANTLTLTLSEEAKASLEETDGFGAADTSGVYTSSNDKIVVSEGFVSDTAGNLSETDAAPNVGVSYTDDVAPTVTSFTTTNEDGSYGVGLPVNITANLSEAVLKGSEFVVTLAVADSGGVRDTVTLRALETGTTLVGSYNVPESRTSGDLNVYSFAAGTVYDVYGNQLSETDIEAVTNLADSADIVIDTRAPETIITSVEYNGEDGILIVTGDKFTGAPGLGVAANTQVKQYLDWTKLVWDIDASDGASAYANVTFEADDIASAFVNTDEKLTITLSEQGKLKLHAADGFGAEGNPDSPDDAIDVQAGFLKDVAGNVGEFASGDNAGEDYYKDNAEISYTDDEGPTVDSFTSTTEEGAYGVGKIVNITANMSERVTQGSEMTVTLGTGGDGYDVTLYASEDGMTMVSKAEAPNQEYVVQARHSTSGEALDVSEIGTASVKDIYGNTLVNKVIDGKPNVSDSVELIIDTQAPTAAIAEIEYDGTTGQITFTGSGFDTIEGGLNENVARLLNWDNLSWQIDADDDGTEYDDVSFTLDDIASAKYTSSDTLVVTLNPDKKASLESSAGFAAAGNSESPADRIVVTDGFIRDRAENAGNTDGVDDITLTYVNTDGAPTVVSFTTTNPDKQYGEGALIEIVATMSEKVIAGSTFTIQLNTGLDQTLDLVADEDDPTGLTLKGTYEVPPEKSADPALDVVKITDLGSVKDIYGLEMVSDEWPSAGDLIESATLVIDTIKPITKISSAAYDVESGVITLTAPSDFGFDNLNVENPEEGDPINIVSQLGWLDDGASRFVWDTDGDGEETSNINFEESDFDSVVVTSPTKLTMTLSEEGLAKLTANPAFGAAQSDGTAASDADDTIDIAVGFMVDVAGNVGENDVKANAEITFSDSDDPTIVSFTSTNDDGSYGLGQEINLTATMSEAVLKGSTITVTLNNTDGSTQTQELVALETGRTLVGAYEIPEGVEVADLGVKSYSLASVTDLWGNTLVQDDPPAGKNIQNTSDISIDTDAPTAKVTAVEYDSELGVLTFSGTDLDSLNVTSGGSLLDNLDWNEFTWDVDATDADSELADISIDPYVAGSDANHIQSATYLGPTSFTVTLTDAGKSALEGSAGFAATGAAGDEGVDTIDIGEGFLKDKAGNLVSDANEDDVRDDKADDLVITYTDRDAPTVASFTSTSDDGSYGFEQEINITATMSEKVIAGSTFTVTFNNTGKTQTLALIAEETGYDLVATYEVDSDVTAPDLGISTFTTGTVTDIYGNPMSSDKVPSGENLSNNSDIAIDTEAPDLTFNSVSFNVSTRVLTIKGSDFNELDVDNATVITSQLDFSEAKLVWDINGDGDETANVTIGAGDVVSAVLKNSGEITITLTEDAAGELAATSGFGASGGSDTVDIAAGFVSDEAGNASDDVKSDAAIAYSDQTGPTVESFTSSSDDKSYGLGGEINITANMSEIVLAGAKITVTLGTTDEVILTAGADGTTLSGTYEVGVGDNSADLTVSSYELGTGEYVVQDIYGNDASSIEMPSGENLSDNSAIAVDTKAPTSKVSSAKYNGSTGVITITGEAFDKINVANGVDVKDYLNWEKLSWDIDGDSSETDVAFNVDDISSAVVTNETTLTITLTDDAKSDLETTANFAAAGSADKLDVSAGFIKDAAGNAATTDVKADASITYTDVTGPRVVSFQAETSDGTYGAGIAIEISATMNEVVQAGSEFVITLGTTDTVTLVAETSGTTLTSDPNYVVSAGDNSADLTITSFTSGTVKDVYGNSMVNTALPGGENLSDNSNIEIDTVPVFNDGDATGTGVDPGDTITLNFSEAVANNDVVEALFTENNTYGREGSRATAEWSNSFKTLTVTLGAGETYDGGDIVLSNVQDAAENSLDTLTFSVEV